LSAGVLKLKLKPTWRQMKNQCDYDSTTINYYLGINTRASRIHSFARQVQAGSFYGRRRRLVSMSGVKVSIKQGLRAGGGVG